MVKPKKKVIKKHGKYILENSKGMFIFNTVFNKGRAFVGGKVIDIGLKKHRKMCKSIVMKGERYFGVEKDQYKGPDLSKLKKGRKEDV